MKIYTTITFIVCTTLAFSQALPISLDEEYTDWQASTFTYTDSQNDGNTIDFLSFSVANDQDYLYVRCQFASEIDLMENNLLVLLIDSDNKGSTGSFVEGIGADLRLNFGNRDATIFTPSFNSMDLEDVRFRVAPTITSHVFEMAIARNTTYQGTPLFQGDTIKLVFRDYNGTGDVMPDANTTFTYVFENTNIPSPTSIDFAPSSSQSLRLMTYNTEFDGLTSNTRKSSFERIITANNPDIITFNETWNTSLPTIQAFMNTILPQPNGWYGYKNNGNATLSKYPILQSWDIHTNRVHAVLIDVSASNFGKDSLLVCNAHLKCCDGDNLRQEQADAFASFIIDAKTIGGQIDLSPSTPFALLGDLNLVGLSQQLTTLLTGQIINTFPYGASAPLDWDDSDLTDAKPRQTDSRMTYTWRNDNSSFPPGRLDFMIYSDAVMTLDKSYVIRTEIMPASQLTQYGLQQNDTQNASDHYPVVSDFSIMTTHTSLVNRWQPAITVAPNPIQNDLHFSIKIDEPLHLTATIYNQLGQQINTQTYKTLPSGNHQLTMPIKPISSGMYQLVITSKKGVYTTSFLKK